MYIHGGRPPWGRAPLDNDNFYIDEQLLATPPHKVTPPGGYLRSKVAARFFSPPEESSLAETNKRFSDTHTTTWSS